MKRKVKFLRIFEKQIEKLDSNAKELIKNKIELIKENPYRFKKLNSKKFNKVFRVRFSIDKKETRLVYLVLEPDIILVCLLSRGDDYKDLEKYLKRAKGELE